MVDDAGQLLAKRHITNDAAGYQLLLELLAKHGDTEEAPISLSTASAPERPQRVPVMSRRSLARWRHALSMMPVAIG
ncbi:hypothetical protein [Streptomyces sp. NPDC058086]|uniref:hypothetical protein n=1 Tax=Streptomyces sp. NPDC058086 TaxID=3346334 RepID=UPI0036EC4FC8